MARALCGYKVSGVLPKRNDADEVILALLVEDMEEILINLPLLPIVKMLASVV